MHVELRVRQLHACRHAVANQRPHLLELYEIYLNGGRLAPGTTQTWVVSMPAIGWRMLADTLSQELYLPGGRVRGKATPSTKSALKQVSRAVIMREAHPALRNAGVAGHVGDLIPVWEVGTDHERWLPFSPYPIEDEFGILRPLHHSMEGMDFTTWEWGDKPSGWAPTWLQEHAHLTFARSDNEAIRPLGDRSFGEA